MYVIFCMVKGSRNIGAIEFSNISELQNALKDNMKGWITYIESIVFFESENE